MSRGAGRPSREFPKAPSRGPCPDRRNRRRPGHGVALELADGGDLKALADYIGGLAVVSLIAANQLARQALAGRLERPNGNGGRTVGETYYPPAE